MATLQRTATAAQTTRRASHPRASTTDNLAMNKSELRHALFELDFRRLNNEVRARKTTRHYRAPASVHQRAAGYCGMYQRSPRAHLRTVGNGGDDARTQGKARL